jgi:hypothetical protein
MKKKIKMLKHRLQYKVENADPDEVGFWFCMAGLLLSQVALYFA